MVVQKRVLRVLLFAGGATREYQFLRTILHREMLEKRVELCVHVQDGNPKPVDLDIAAERLLDAFPGKLGPNDAGKKFMSLNDYDVIVAFDPDWSKLTPKQLAALREWVATHAGGIIFVAGPVNTYQLARPGGRDLSSLQALYPVTPMDNRLHGGGPTPLFALKFTSDAGSFNFLKLDEAGASPTAGWNAFFHNYEQFQIDPFNIREPKRGFYSYHPVQKIRPASTVVASVLSKGDQPFIVSMRYGQGTTLYLGSGEFWRLRGFKEGYHERLWVKMLRFVAPGSTAQKRISRILMARGVPTGPVAIEAQLRGKDFLPLPRDVRPEVLVRRIDRFQPKEQAVLKFELRGKPGDGDWEGRFAGSVTLKEPGEYEFQILIPGTNESLVHRVVVRQENPELDNVRPNFAYLHQLASEAETVLKGLPPEVRKEIEAALSRSAEASFAKDAPRLFFRPLEEDGIVRSLNSPARK